MLQALVSVILGLVLTMAMVVGSFTATLLLLAVAAFIVSGAARAVVPKRENRLLR